MRGAASTPSSVVYLRPALDKEKLGGGRAGGFPELAIKPDVGDR